MKKCNNNKENYLNLAHCSNPEVRIRKKLKEKSEADMRTPMKRASKQATT